MRWKTLFILGNLLILIAACKGTPQNVPASFISPHLHIATYSATVKVPSGQRTSTVVSCKPGEQMLGGGFASGDLFEYAASIEASYPSSATTWTVTGFASASFFDVTALVYCLQTKLPLDIHILHTTDTSGTNITCPQGTVLLNEGFDSAQTQDTSSLQSNGEISPAAGTSYVLCAANHVVSGKPATTVFNPHSMAHGYNPGEGNVRCPTGQIATGGEFTASDTILGSEATGKDFAGWSVVAGGDTDMTISAICVIFLLSM